MADTYHAIKLYKTTANSTTSSKRVGINVTDSTVTTGYALYVNGAINITDSLKTNSLNTGDLVVTGSASFTNGISVGGELILNKISAPTASGGTTYGNGTSGQVLKSNGTTVYWASDNNTNTLVRTYASTNNIEIPFIGGSTGTTPAAPTHTSSYANLYGAIPGTIADRATINLSTGVVSVKGLKIFGLTTAANAIAIYSDANGTLSTKSTASGAAYATATNGALTFGTLPVAQGGTGATSLANITVGRATADASGNTITSTYLKLSGGTLTGDLTFSSEEPFIYFDYQSKHYGAIYNYDGVVIRNYATNGTNFEDYALPTPGAITTNSDYDILTSKLTNTFTDTWDGSDPKSSTLFSSISTGSSLNATVFQWGKLIHISFVISRGVATAPGDNLFQATLKDEYLPYGRVSGAAYYGSCGILGIIFGENDGDANEKKTIKIRVVGSTLPANGSVGIGFFYMLKN